MKFLCIGYFDRAKMDALTPMQVSAVMSDCPMHMQRLRETERLQLNVGVDVTARYLARRGGKLVTLASAPNSAADTIGCVFVVEANDVDAAASLAALHPTTQIPAGEHLGWRLEVRPIHTFEAAPG